MAHLGTLAVNRRGKLLERELAADRHDAHNMSRSSTVTISVLNTRSSSTPSASAAASP